MGKGSDEKIQTVALIPHRAKKNSLFLRWMLPDAIDILWYAVRKYF
jgi:hypothetical protein